MYAIFLLIIIIVDNWQPFKQTKRILGFCMYQLPIWVENMLKSSSRYTLPFKKKPHDYRMSDFRDYWHRRFSFLCVLDIL